MDAVHARYIRTETAISAIPNAVIGAAFVWLMFGGRDRIGLWGMDGLAFDLVPTVFMITLMTTVALTLLTRARMRKGAVPRMTARRRLPRLLPLRAVTLAAVTTLVVAPLSILLLWAIWTGPWSYGAVMAFKIVFCVALGFLVTPVVLHHALCDDAGEPAPPIRT